MPQCLRPYLTGALLLLSATPGLAHMQGMYATQAEAAQRAAELKCKGTHPLGDHWMPCADEKSMHEALSRQ